MKTAKTKRGETPEEGKNEFQYMNLSEAGKEEAESRHKENNEKEASLSWELLTDDSRKETESMAEEPADEPTEEETAALLRAEEAAPAKSINANGQKGGPSNGDNTEPSGEQPAEQTAELSDKLADGKSGEPTEPAKSFESLSPEEQRFRRVRGLFEYVETFCLALSVMILLFLFVFRYVAVDGGSMEPTLHGGAEDHTYSSLFGGQAHTDRLIISDFLYTPKTGDIVVISKENRGVETPDSIIKRVIATEGQTVRINFRTWEVRVDGVLLDEDYINREEGLEMDEGLMNRFYGIDENGVCEFTVSPGKVFVMGDNRNNSSDSRLIGEQDVDHILGKVLLRIYPFGEFGTV